MLGGGGGLVTSLGPRAQTATIARHEDFGFLRCGEQGDAALQTIAHVGQTQLQVDGAGLVRSQNDFSAGARAGLDLAQEFRMEGPNNLVFKFGSFAQANINRVVAPSAKTRLPRLPPQQVGHSNQGDVGVGAIAEHAPINERCARCHQRFGGRHCRRPVAIGIVWLRNRRISGDTAEDAVTIGGAIRAQFQQKPTGGIPLGLVAKSVEIGAAIAPLKVQQIVGGEQAHGLSLARSARGIEKVAIAVKIVESQNWPFLDHSD